MVAFSVASPGLCAGSTTTCVVQISRHSLQEFILNDHAWSTLNLHDMLNIPMNIPSIELNIPSIELNIPSIELEVREQRSQVGEQTRGERSPR